MDEKFQNLKVMVIDDSKTIRRTAETLLQREGCEVVTAVDGFEALAKIAEANPDIVFVDKLTKTTKHAKRHFWLNDVCTCHGLLPSHSA